MSMLADRLKQEIAAQGPMPLDVFWREAMTAADGGYYAGGAPIGAGGDFTTAPEVSQVFGELAGLWLVDVWVNAGRPPEFTLMELGPGRGQLMADALRAAAVEPEFLESARLVLVEASAPMREMQAERLAQYGPEWRDDWESALAAEQDAPLFLVANEFLDALPIKQFLKTDGLWRERLVGLDAMGAFKFMLGDIVQPPNPGSAVDLDAAPEGAVLEHGEERNLLASSVARRLSEYDGAALFFDYGYAKPQTGATLQALAAGRPSDPLSAPGSADITSHVSFGPFLSAAEIAGARGWGPVEQGVLLLGLGAEQRAAQLVKNAEPAAAEQLMAGLRRLLHPQEMGRQFKAAALLPAVYPPPTGFDY